MRNLLLYFLIAVGLLGTTALAQPELDASFSGDGRTSVIFGALATTQDMAIQLDNKIILVSVCHHINYNRIPFCAVRVNENGSFDSTFSSNTPAAEAGVYAFLGSGGEVRSVAVSDEGKVVVAGYVPGAGGGDIALVRYNSNGSPDSTFGMGGTVIADLQGNSDRAERVAFQPDGKLLVTGTSGLNQYVARYLNDGTLDPSFGKGGVFRNAMPEGASQGFSIALQPDGKIVAGGVGGGGFLVTRLNTDGTPDTTWDGDGFKIGNGSRSISVQTDGRIVGLGTNKVYRMNSDGSTDTTFNGNGSQVALNGTGTQAFSMHVSASGKITVVGTAGPATCPGFPFPCFAPDYNYLTARFKGNGSSDTSYSGDGYLDVPFSGASSGARAVSMDYAGRLVVAGVSSSCCVNTFWEQPVFSVMRLAAPPVKTVNISGRVIGPDGNGVSNITVSTQGVSARTNPFGYYVLRVQTNQTYTISARAKDEISFGKRRVTVDDEISGLDLYGTN